MDADQARDVLRESWVCWSGQQQQWFRRLSPTRQRDLLAAWEAALSDCQRWAVTQALVALGRQVDPFRGNWEFVGQLIRAQALEAERSRRQLARQLQRRAEQERMRREYLQARGRAVG